ncbi:MFS transporter [Streptomyces caniscabiei]|nr:MFS transporter [Streptomyces caniscabiei]MDX2604261.1 MFS transporter [Streptomyces caniscabiei]MDX2735603.1 MFS transporter [Streptomyces caniscabiei]MDX2776994.1 MFS transporter [Streptomyces caniscabiei]
MDHAAHPPNRPRTGRALTVLGLAAMSYALAQTSIAPALPEMAASLHSSAQDVTWAFTAYLVSAAVLTPVMGRLGDMFGRRRMLVVALALFAAGGAMAALADSLGPVIAGRVVMGAGGGILPLCFGIIRDTLPDDRRRAALGFMSAIAGVGGGLGLLLGGVLADHTSYRWIFWTGTLLALLSALAAHSVLPPSVNRTRGRVDLAGTVLLTAGITAPLIAISRATEWGWSSGPTLGLTALGLTALVVFVRVERHTADPLIDMGVLGRGPVVMTNLASLLIGFGQFGVFLLVPQLIQTPTTSGYGFGGDATRAGLLMLPGSLTMLAAGPLSGRLGARFGGKTPLALGGSITGTGLLALALHHDSEHAVMAFTTLAFTGIGMSFAAMPNLIVDSVEPTRTGEATGVNVLVRAVGASLGTQVVAAILADSTDVSSPHPAAHAYTVSFAAAAAGTLIAVAVALLIPRPQGRPHVPAPEGSTGPPHHERKATRAARTEAGESSRRRCPSD